MSNILETISSFVRTYIDQVLTIFDGFDGWLQAVILLALALFALVGLFVFLKKFIKLFLVLAVLGGVFYYLYTQTDLLTGLFGYLNLFSANISIF